MKDNLQQQILKKMLEKDGYITGKQLSYVIGVSPKTIQNKMHEIRAEIVSYGAVLESKKGLGFLLCVHDEMVFQAYLNDSVQNSESSENRSLLILQELLSTSGYIKAETLCDKLYISKSTLTYDLKEIRKYLTQFHLTLTQKPHYGLRIEGKEFYVRMCLADLLINRSELLVCKEADFNTINTFYLKALLYECMEQYHYDIADTALDNLIIHIQIALQRVQHGITIDMSMDPLELGEDDITYPLAQYIVQRIQEAFHISLPCGEWIYLAIHLNGKRVYHEQDIHIVTPEINNLVDEILHDVKEKRNIDLTKDLDLRMMLALHLMPFSTRIQYHMILRNPLLDEIKCNLLLAYDVAVCASETIQKNFQAMMDEHEISYFALHFDIALHRKKEQIVKKNILVVCSSGKASSKLLEYKIKANFDPYIEQLKTCKMSELAQCDLQEFDVIFTTIPLLQPMNVPVFEIQYLLGKDDLEKISRVLNDDPSINQEGILSCFDERLFFCDVSLNDKEEVVKFLVNSIEEVRNLPENFYEEIMKRETYGATDLIHNVAFPHPNTSLSEDTFFAIAILKKPILWSKHKVRIVFLASISKSEDLITDLYTKIVAELLSSQRMLQELIEAPTYETLVEILKDICEREGTIC